MNALIRRPSEPKEPNRDTQTANHGIVQPMLGQCERVALCDSFVVVCLVNFLVDKDICGSGEDNASADGNEGEADLRG